MRKYRNYTDQNLIDAVKISKSISDVLRILNLKEAGGNFKTIKIKIAKLNLDTSHFTGMLWSKDQRLKDWSNYKRTSNLKKHLIKERKNTCENCHLDKWLNVEIPLEVHHIDGNPTNNNLENLQLLCCNCHSLTDNWRNKKRSSDETVAHI
jgi:hypothetical protein